METCITTVPQWWTEAVAIQKYISYVHRYRRVDFADQYSLKPNPNHFCKLILGDVSSFELQTRLWGVL